MNIPNVKSSSFPLEAKKEKDFSVTKLVQNYVTIDRYDFLEHKHDYEDNEQNVFVE